MGGGEGLKARLHWCFVVYKNVQYMYQTMDGFMGQCLWKGDLPYLCFRTKQMLALKCMAD